MEYKIIGGDGNEYGPISLEVMKQWVTEGRIAAESKVMRTDQTSWSTASAYPELSVGSAGAALPPPPLPLTASAPTGSGQSLEADPAWADEFKKLRSGASWFYWIAGLTLVNSLLIFLGVDRSFSLGLGITLIIDWIGHNQEFGLGNVGHVVAFVLDLMAIATFVAFGLFAHKKHTWALLVGGIIYALDGLIYLIGPMVMGIIIHIFALISIFGAYQACRRIRAAEGR